MDTGFLNHLGEEHFSTFTAFDEYDGHEDSTSLDERPDFSDWENERELNGDIGLIPVSGSFCESIKDFSETPPSDFFHRMVEWSNLVNIDVVGVDGFSHEDADKSFHRPENMEVLQDFDMLSYINAPKQHIIKAGVKKIDVEAQKYIVDSKTDQTNESADTSDDLIDVETVFESSSLPVLEANDALSLLEQFEASEKPNLAKDKTSIDDFFNQGEINKVPKTPTDIFEEASVAQKTDVESEKKVNSVKKDDKVDLKQSKNKQIIDALPQELIQRINESGKRKTITVIPPIPTNKKRPARFVDNLPRSKIPKFISERVHVEHDYCSVAFSYPKEPKKDSGFESAEEDERSIIRNQKMVKNADGTLMVSLLKINTIRSNIIQQQQQKKKLNLEEYKKRRLIGSNTTSVSSSPGSSTCSSPLPEDENLKRLKHQEKLMKMAADLLNTPPKSGKTPLESDKLAKAVPQVKSEEIEENLIETQISPPEDFEVKTYVSIGTNTDISHKHTDLLASVEHLADIKPLLQKVSDKINSNSFITSLIENIPKIKNMTEVKLEEDGEVVREDKIIHYLKKNRPTVSTKSVGVQTEIMLMDEDMQCRYRRRINSYKSPRSSPDSSSTSSSYQRRSRSSRLSRSSLNPRNRSQSSSSCSSNSSSSSRSRSRSRSLSPRRPSRCYNNIEKLREVEERRVVYVGRIGKGTIKDDLRRRFQQFGTITNISLHFRDYGDNYGFVTFANKEDAYEALEHGNDGYVHPKYDLSFGGRRIFCQTTYSDLDNMRDDEYNYYSSRANESSFDALLRAAQEKLRKRKP